MKTFAVDDNSISPAPVAEKLAKHGAEVECETAVEGSDLVI